LGKPLAIQSAMEVFAPFAADASYGNGEFLQWLMDREITPYMPTRDAVACVG